MDSVNFLVFLRGLSGFFVDFVELSWILLNFRGLGGIFSDFLYMWLNFHRFFADLVEFSYIFAWI